MNKRNDNSIKDVDVLEKAIIKWDLPLKSYVNLIERLIKKLDELDPTKKVRRGWEE